MTKLFFTESEPLDIVGKSKIADRLGVATSTVDYWRAHNGFPEPVSVVSVVESGPGSYPVWLWADVQEWASEARPATYGPDR